ncbi:MAG: type IX secretion system membrane protein PorP/SprF [Bacteroidales bacterium]
MKKIITIIMVLFTLQCVNAQQVSLTSQYMMNHFVLNPAIAGINDYIPINLNIRNQWINIKGAPVTESLSAHAYLGKNMGFGGCFFNDVTGPTRRTGLNLSLAYHLRLNKDYTQMLSFGLSGVFFQHFINIEQLTTDEPENMSIVNGFNNQFCQDANFGVYYQHKDKYYAGFSILNLLEAKKDLLNSTNTIKNPIKRTYYLNGGYFYEINENYGLEPSVLLQKQENTPVQMDINVRCSYKKMFWLGGSYRVNDAVVMMFAFDMKEFAVGYSYDLTLSEIRKHSAGSHEVNLIYRIFKKDAFTRHKINNSFPLFN